MHIATRTVMAIAMLIAASASHAQDSDPLQAITRCFDGGEFHAESKDRRTAANPYRTVNTAAGPRQVSVADGYRLLIHRSSKEPLVNLKIERSAPGKFADDRATILLELARVAASKPSHPIAIESSTQNGIEIAGLNNPALGTPGVISMYQLFDAASGTIATAYILNQASAEREFSDDASYGVLRDRFIGKLSACMAHPPQ